MTKAFWSKTFWHKKNDEIRDLWDKGIENGSEVIAIIEENCVSVELQLNKVDNKPDLCMLLCLKYEGTGWESEDFKNLIPAGEDFNFTSWEQIAERMQNYLDSYCETHNIDKTKEYHKD